jgi:hypothetical protein
MDAFTACLPGEIPTAIWCSSICYWKEQTPETGNYMRIGSTKISPYERKQSKVLERSGDKKNIPYGNWSARENTEFTMFEKGVRQ